MGYHGGLCNLVYIFNEDYEIQTGNTKTLQKYIPSSNEKLWNPKTLLSHRI